MDYRFGGETMAELSEAKAKSNKRWDDKNKDKKRIYRYRSYSRKYVRDIASKDDLLELQQMIDKRLKEL